MQDPNQCGVCRVTISAKTAVNVGPAALRAMKLQDVDGSRACCKSCSNEGKSAYISLKRASESNLSTPVRRAKVCFPVCSVRCQFFNRWCVLEEIGYAASLIKLDKKTLEKKCRELEFKVGGNKQELADRIATCGRLDELAKLKAEKERRCLGPLEAKKVAAYMQGIAKLAPRLIYNKSTNPVESRNAARAMRLGKHQRLPGTFSFVFTSVILTQSRYYCPGTFSARSDAVILDGNVGHAGWLPNVLAKMSVELHGSAKLHLSRMDRVLALSRARRKKLVGKNGKHLRNPFRKNVLAAAAKNPDFTKHKYKGTSGVLCSSKDATVWEEEEAEEENAGVEKAAAVALH